MPTYTQTGSASYGMRRSVADPDNTAPYASSVEISGTPSLTNVLTGHYIYWDADGDAEGTSTFRWLRNGVAIAGETALTHTLSGRDSGKLIQFEVTPVAATGVTTGSPVMSANMAIVDASGLYYLYDTFDTALSAGNVNGTLAEPVGGARTVTDTNGKISIAGGVLNVVAGSVLYDGVWYPIQTRVPGKTLLTSVNVSAGRFRLGWSQSNSGGISDQMNNSGTALNITINGGGSVAVGVVALSAQYQYAETMRTNGAFFWIKGGAFTNWTLLFSSMTGAGSEYPGVEAGSGATDAFTADNIRVPKALYIPVPLESDGFSAATTDGAGNAENNGPVGHVWTDIGTWGVAGGVLSCSVLSGGVGYRYLTASSANVIVAADLTRTAGNAGIHLYTNASNYITAYTEGTNCVCVETVAGTPTTLRTGAVTYGAGKRIVLIIDGTTGRLFYDNAAVGASFTITNPSAKVGCYTTNTGNSFDNFVCWARGTSNEYSGLDQL